jgi:hypothetical protein
MVGRSGRGGRSWATRILRLAACVVVGLVLGTSLVTALIRAGVIRNPFAPVVGGDLALAQSGRPGLRVLFVGNSFTFENDLPALVHQLAAADARAGRIFAVDYTAPGWSLRQAAADDGLSSLLRRVRWNVVVLQEQSRIPSLSAARRRRELNPFASELVRRIRSVGAHPLLFMTWGYENGDRRGVRGDDFESMQARLARGYWDLGAELSAPVAPVGLAWAEALRRKPDLDLWGGDGRHPNRPGSYLAACVFYAIVSGRSAIGNAFTAGIARPEARFLQRVAADIALGEDTGVRMRPDAPRVTNSTHS